VRVPWVELDLANDFCACFLLKESVRCLLLVCSLLAAQAGGRRARAGGWSRWLLFH
jgi:hypothetical protein